MADEIDPRIKWIGIGALLILISWLGSQILIRWRIQTPAQVSAYLTLSDIFTGIAIIGILIIIIIVVSMLSNKQ